jgi:hypothetical protein
LTYTHIGQALSASPWDMNDWQISPVDNIIACQQGKYGTANLQHQLISEQDAFIARGS